MNHLKTTMRESVTEFCTRIGLDPLLVQGAGGNVSWKDGDILWVKASGTWLAEAAEKDIFVPVSLPHLHRAIDTGNFSVTPTLIGESKLRPSIETLLHALMPHRVVVHLHAIEVLAHLVRENFQSDLISLVDPKIQWSIVEYHKPGENLASAVHSALKAKPQTNVIFLRNHGVVVGGADVDEVNNTINTLTNNLRTDLTISRSESLRTSSGFVLDENKYIPIEDENINQLAINPEFINRLVTDWAIYPDHIVFLGSRPYVYLSLENFKEKIIYEQIQPELIFINGLGVFIKPSFNKAKKLQLRCYYDVLCRQNTASQLSALNDNQIAELLNWDAETYRMSISK